jgi:hypothetical protein
MGFVESCRLHVRHDVVEEPVGLAGVVEREDVRMTELGSDLDLAQEAFRTYCSSELRTKDLYGNLATVFEVLGKIDRRHPTATNDALNSIAVSEGSFEAIELVRHGRSQ